MYYEFPVLSSRDCLMKEPIFPTCPSDDGQRITKRDKKGHFKIPPPPHVNP